MADPPPTTTSTIPDPTQVANYLTQIANLGTLIADVFNRVTGNIGAVGGSIDSLMSKFTGVTKATADMTAETNKQSLAAGLLQQQVLGVGNAFDKLAGKAVGIQSISEQFSQVRASADFTTSALMKVGQALGIPNAGALGSNLADAVAKASEGADQFLKLKNAYVETQGASGGLSQALARSGTNFEDLNGMVTQHGVFLNNVAKETGNSTSQVGEYWKTLATAIPGAASAQVNALDGSGRSTTGLTAVMRLAAGSGQEYGSVITNLTNVWSAYNLESQQSLEYTSRIYEANDKLGLKMDTTQGFVAKNIEAFKGLSDKGDNAVDVLNNMYDAFRRTGLSANESVGLIGNMTAGLSKLTLGQKAFLSAQSGGPGGLRGGLQIEKQLRDGDIQGVLDKAQTALKSQFGGKIYSQQEALQSDDAAAQFVRQRELLKSGAFGIKAQDDNQATRILEAFKNGTSGTEALKDGQSTLNDRLSSGEKLQQDGNNFLSGIQRNTELLQLLANGTAFDGLQKYLGSTQGQERPDFAATNALALRANADAANRAATLQLSQNRSGNPVQQTNEVALRTAGFQQAKDLITNLIPSLPKSTPTPAAQPQASTNLQTRDNAGNEKEAYLSLFTSIRNQNTGRGAAVGNPAGFAGNQTTPQGPGQQRPGNQPGQQNHTTDHKFDVTFRGLCVDCARPIQPDAHMQARTDGAAGTK